MNFREKMLSWMPAHFRTQDYELYVSAAAAVFEDLKVNINDMFEETYISEAGSRYLDVHGRERGLSRVTYGTPPNTVQESNTDFARRISRIKYTRTKENIIANVVSVLGFTEVEVRNDEDQANFFSGASDKRAVNVDLGTESFGLYGPLDLKLRRKCFSVLLRTPIPNPLSYYDDSFFFDDGAFMDTRENIINNAIIEVLKTLIKQKAPAGAGFRILVKDFTGIPVGTEAEQEAELNRI